MSIKATRNLCGMTNYPIGPNRTPSDQSALNIVLPPANHRTVIHSLTRVHLRYEDTTRNTFDNRYTRYILKCGRPAGTAAAAAEFEYYTKMRPALNVLKCGRPNGGPFP